MSNGVGWITTELLPRLQKHEANLKQAEAALLALRADLTQAGTLSPTANKHLQAAQDAVDAARH